MNIFEKAKQIETRKDYVDSRLRSFKYLEEEFSDMQDYILICAHTFDEIEAYPSPATPCKRSNESF